MVKPKEFNAIKSIFENQHKIFGLNILDSDYDKETFRNYLLEQEVTKFKRKDTYSGQKLGAISLTLSGNSAHGYKITATNKTNPNEPINQDKIDALNKLIEYLSKPIKEIRPKWKG